MICLKKMNGVSETTLKSPVMGDGSARRLIEVDWDTAIGMV